MSDCAIQIEHLFKKFKKGEIHDSLRDLVPALTGKFLGGTKETGLEKREFWALHDVSFEVDRGEAFGIVGSNGAGKSTILKLLSKILKPTSGSITVNGTLSALIEVSAGFHPDLTGRENIYLNGTILGMSRKEIKRRFDQIVDFSGLEDFLDTPVKRYSSGMFARLGFSVAAHVDPDILIVDEVLSVGDWAFQQRCLRRMTEVVQSGATVLFVSHNLRAISGLCERSLLLDHGRVLEVGPSDEVVRTYLTGAEERRSSKGDREVEISSIRLMGEDGQRNHFQSGEEAFVEVEVTSRGNFNKLAVGIAVNNTELLRVFSTSTEVLGDSSISVSPDEKITCTFTLDLHLAAGTYFFSCWVNRLGMKKEYDRYDCAATFFVDDDEKVRGVANLHPKVAIKAGRAADPSRLTGGETRIDPTSQESFSSDTD